MGESTLNQRVDDQLKRDRNDAKDEAGRTAKLNGCILVVVFAGLAGIHLVAWFFFGRSLSLRDIEIGAVIVFVLTLIGLVNAQSDEARDIRDRRLIRVELQLNAVLNLANYDSSWEVSSHNCRAMVPAGSVLANLAACPAHICIRSASPVL